MEGMHNPSLRTIKSKLAVPLFSTHTGQLEERNFHFLDFIIKGNTC